MSRAYQPPKEEEGNSASSEYKRPDLIIIEDTNDSSENHSPPFQEESKSHYRSPQTPQSTVSLRLICAIGFLICFIFAMGLLIWSVLLTLLTVLTFFQNPALNRASRLCWQLYTNLVMTTLGFGLGILFPRIGLGLLIFYFAVKGDSSDPGIWRQIFQRSFGGL